MSRKGEKSLDYAQQVQMHNAMSEGVRYKNSGFEALEKGKYEKAIEDFETGLELMERGFGPGTPCAIPYLVGISEANIKLKKWDLAEKPAKKLLKLGRKVKDDGDVKTATELLSEIEIVRSFKIRIFFCYFIGTHNDNDKKERKIKKK